MAPRGARRYLTDTSPGTDPRPDPLLRRRPSDRTQHTRLRATHATFRNTNAPAKLTKTTMSIGEYALLAVAVLLLIRSLRKSARPAQD